MFNPSNNSSLSRTILIGASKRILSGDQYLANMSDPFEPPLVAVFSALAKQSDARTALDIGANIGATALLLSEMYEEVIAFEPSPRTFKTLQHNIAENNVTNVRCQCFGLGSENSVATLTAATDNASGGFLSDCTATLDGHLRETVAIKKGDETIREILAGRRVNFIKLDVEGHEVEVLSGLCETIQRDRPTVVLEMNHWCLNAFKRRSVPDFLESLDGFYSYIFAFDDCTRELVDISRDLPFSRYQVMHEHIVNNRYFNLMLTENRELGGIVSEALASPKS